MLKAKDIVFSRGHNLILNGVDLEVNAGEFVAILGKNGEGKTTLVNILAGLSKPNSGEVKYNNRDLNDFSLKELRHQRAVLPQSFSISFEMTVYDFLLLSKRINGALTKEDFEVVDEMISRFSLERFLQRSLLRLSGGELQRVLFAKTLLQISPLSSDRPAILFLDEPTSALDLEIQQKILEALRDLTREYKLAVVAVLHDVNQASMYCDKLCLLSGKQVVAYDAPEAVITVANVEKYFKVKANIIYSETRKPILTY